VHLRGSDHRANDILLKPGIKIGPPEMAILTAAGKPEVEIARWPDIAVISTGDELVDVGEPINAAQIRSSNDRAIETVPVETTKIAHARQCNGHQPIEELVHPVAPQRYLAADVHAFAQLEIGDRLARLAQHGLLAGYRRDFNRR